MEIEKLIVGLLMNDYDFGRSGADEVALRIMDLLDRWANDGDQMEALTSEPTPVQKIRMWAVEQIQVRDWDSEAGTNVPALIAAAKPLAHWAETGCLVEETTVTVTFNPTPDEEPAPVRAELVGQAVTVTKGSTTLTGQYVA